MYSARDLADIHYVYGMCRGSGRAARIEYRRMFPDRRLPNAQTFVNSHRRIQELAELDSARRINQPARTIDVETEERILAVVRNNPELSTRQIGAQLGLSHWTVWKVLHNERMHPFHTLQVQELLDADKPRRAEFCRLLLELDLDDDTFLGRVLWTDESIFTRGGVFNTHNTHTWSRENPRMVKATNMQRRFSVNVWAGIVGTHLIGPHVFEDHLNGRIYLAFLQEQLPVMLAALPEDIQNSIIYQHDGAPPHNTLPVREHLNETFPARWIGRNGHIEWPARSPDLSPLDFYLWGHWKELVYSVPINTREQLIARIFDTAGAMRQKLQEINITTEVKRRALYCIQEDGGHFEQLLK